MTIDNIVLLEEDKELEELLQDVEDMVAIVSGGVDVKPIDEKCYGDNKGNKGENQTN